MIVKKKKKKKNLQKGPVKDIGSAGGCSPIGAGVRKVWYPGANKPHPALSISR